MNEQNEERLLDLLCKQVIEGLTVDEQNELSKLEQNIDSSVDLTSLELTAASISISAVNANESLPDHLKAGILSSADEHVAETNAVDSPESRVGPAQKRPSMPIWSWLGWAAAAAACIVLAINIYQTRGDQRTQNITPTPTPALRTPSAAEKRDQLLASAPDVVRTDWGPGNMKNLAIGGDVVWSDVKQEGYMRFRDLPKNDVNAYTYQLWIFDETQDEKTPIDGGIFDVNADGEVIVPINANLRARGAKAFAITMEKPGGVMVSKREKIVALAAVKPSTA